MIVFLFLSHLGVGIALTLALVSSEAGLKFFRFNGGLAAILIGAALALRAPDSEPLQRAATASLMTSEAILIVYWITLGRALTRARPAILALAIASGVAALVLQGLAFSAGAGVAVQTMTAASFLSSAALLGGACTAMILGHWYLVIPSLEIGHLQSIVKVHIVSMIVRVVVVVAAVVVAADPRFHRYIMSVAGVFFWQRVLFGLAGPALLSYLTWETAKIRSTQSATGILYVDFFTVMVGEALAKYLLLATHVPV